MAQASIGNPPTGDIVVIEHPRSGIAVIAVNRPQQRNALNIEVKRRIGSALAELAADPQVRVVIVTGKSSMFVAGTDLAEMVDMEPRDHAERGTNDVWVALRVFPKLLIAAVEKFAFGGGCELALSCDIIIVGEQARIGLPEIKVGIMPGAGGTQFLLRTVGRYRAARMILTGEPITGHEAATIGLASEAVPDGTALDRALEMAETIAALPQASVLAIKQALRGGHDAHMSDALVRERELFIDLFGKPDQREGMRAFLDKRPAQFNRG